MQRPGPWTLRFAASLALWLLLPPIAAHAAWPDTLAHQPLAPPMYATGSFGEHRASRFHAGVDLSTGETVGRPVMAPADGWVERVRSSGVGYGRSIYLRTADGRTFVFGHLDAFDEPLASYVDQAKRSSGHYEQDLWPEARRFTFRAGQRMAWSGQSGAGPPHLHVEIRRGDMNYNPQLHGLEVVDRAAPAIQRLLFEPLDDSSYVEGGVAPWRVRPGGGPDTVHALGRVRAWIEARDFDGVRASWRLPYGVSLDWPGTHVECRFDSVAWGPDMAEADWIFDAGGRADRGTPLALWCGAAFTPSVFTSPARGQEGGVMTVRPGDPPRTAVVAAWDLSGHRTERRVVLAPPPPGTAWPDTTAAVRPGRGRGLRPGSWSTTVLPGRFVRVTYRGAPAGVRDVRLGVSRGGSRPAVVRGDAIEAVLAFGAVTGPCSLWVAGSDARGGSWNDAMATTVLALAEGAGNQVRLEDRGAHEGFSWWLPAGGTFGPALLFVEASEPARGTSELVPESRAYRLGPVSLPLRLRPRVRIRAPAADDPRVGLYHDSGYGWSFEGGARDSTDAVTADARLLGRFALLADTLAPRIRLLRPRSHPRRGPYSRWAVGARLVEHGSGVDANRSTLVVDGEPVPSEWDPEARVLRWRPLHPPASGRHRIEVVAVDRAGNTRRARGTFVLD